MDCFWVYAVWGDWWPACLVRVVLLWVCLVLVKCYVVYGLRAERLVVALRMWGLAVVVLACVVVGVWVIGSAMLFGGWVCYVCGLACYLLGCV